MPIWCFQYPLILPKFVLNIHGSTHVSRYNDGTYYTEFHHPFCSRAYQLAGIEIRLFEIRHRLKALSGWIPEHHPCVKNLPVSSPLWTWHPPLPKNVIIQCLSLSNPACHAAICLPPKTAWKIVPPAHSTADRRPG